MTRFVCGILAVLAMTVVARAQLIFPVEQERHLEAYVWADNYPEPLTDSQSADAPDMQPWAESIAVSVGGSVTPPAAVLRYAVGGLAPEGGAERADELQGGS
ncbi:MAG: hypothetical protein ABIG44_04025 [Planctomycetota bacterium]